MRRTIALSLALVLLVTTLAPAAHAAINVERSGSENPMVEISRSVIYGGLAGLMVGSAFAIASNGNNKGDIIRWSFAGGTALGLGVGLYYVSHRPQPQAMLEWHHGAAELHAPALAVSPAGTLQTPLVSVRF